MEKSPGNLKRESSLCEYEQFTSIFLGKSKRQKTNSISEKTESQIM